ncbi:hypothetical protein FACS1894172_12290 [Spirochaetia bacterium]|nr:hypothetical protein FACS1894164_15860 [Spirochaetia bacterium]GHU33551.1 hypothetical protein FACS1894172_12290 [Spirochaetia bacterium]
MFKLGLTLALYATGACVLLAFVYTGTKTIIEDRQQADLKASLQELFPAGDSFEPVIGCGTSPDPAVTLSDSYSVKKSGTVIGMAISASTASYGGPLKLLVGVNADSTISAVKILEHSDTPGLGANAASPTYFVNKPEKITFYGQFSGKSAWDPFEVKNDVVAVTASTISSRAIANAVKICTVAASDWFSGQ